MLNFWVYEPGDLGPFSRRFQWIPCKVKFVESSEVEIISYINNLHPCRFKSLYSTIGKLISLAIEPWNDVLIKSGRGRHPARILTWGVEWDTKSGDGGWPSRETLLELENNRNSEAFRSMVYRIREYLFWPEDYPAQTRSWNPLFFKTPFNSAEWEEQRGGLESAINAKWKRLRKWEHPEPGISAMESRAHQQCNHQASNTTGSTATGSGPRILFCFIGRYLQRARLAGDCEAG